MASKETITRGKFRDIAEGASDAYHQVGRTTHLKQYGSSAGAMVMSDSAICSGQLYIPGEDFRAVAEIFNLLADRFQTDAEKIRINSERTSESGKKPQTPDGIV